MASRGGLDWRASPNLLCGVMEGQENGSGPRTLPELTLRAVVAGIGIGILFGAANAYLGLKVGITVSASIPAAVMSVAIFRALSKGGLMRPAGVLENNMVQTVGSAGESLAAGVIFTVPALILLGFAPGVLNIFVLGALGGVLGILLMVPLRRYLIIREHKNLVYPEGTACASVLRADQEGGKKGGLVFAGLGVGAAFEFLVSGMGLWRSKPAWELPRIPAAEISADSSPALLGVGYVIGPKIAAIMFGGGALAWLVFIPAIKLFGSGAEEAIYPADIPVSEMDAHDIWHYYMRYIGAGAVVFGGIVTLIKSLPVIVSSAKAIFKGLGGESGPDAEDVSKRDLPGWALIAGSALIIILMAVLPDRMAPSSIPATLLAVVFAFFFVAVSSRIVGLIGSSSNPVSGMTIAALLGTTVVFKLMGWTGPDHEVTALAVGAIVCISTAIAGDTSQDLKTGYLVGATPWKQQSAEIIGVLTSAAVIGFVVLRLHQGYGIGGEELPAPQATLMSLVVRGVLSGELPWTLIFIGVAAAAVVELLGIPSLPFAVGLYLPISLSTPILAGGVIRHIVKRKEGKAGKEEEDETEAEELVGDRGVLFASGLIAGAAFVGMAIGLLWSFSGGDSVVDKVLTGINIGPGWAGSFENGVSALVLLLLGALLYIVSRSRKGAS